MHIVRYTTHHDSTPKVGSLIGDELHELAFTSMHDLLTHRLDDIEPRLDAGVKVIDSWTLLPPIDGLTELWAAGVTYQRSQEARMEESVVSDVYSRVYDADRPELFLKSVAWRVVTHDEFAAIRTDSDVDVPEPELALVLNSFGEIVGLTICNDMSSRTIEGENPLYLPQAKIYAGSASLGPGIRPVWEVSDPSHLAISVDVIRDGTSVWTAHTSTAHMHRTFDDLVGYLRRSMEFPHGAILATGTGVVPELDFTLHDGDVVHITIDEIGTLTNTITSNPDQFNGLPDRRPKIT
jgi:2-dehydro-3-deoxy-D-arabinonate dehydratase